ncbi:MAG: cytochrome c oxidase subunit 3 family protein [Arenicellales bacterium]
MNAVTRLSPGATFEDEPRLLPGDLAIWFFIFAELLVFGAFFIVYSVVRIQNLSLFNEFQETLNRGFGAINTVLLITSSYFVVRAVQAIKRDDKGACLNWLYASMGAGTCFLSLKTYEFYVKFSAGVNLDTNTFYFFYLSLTMFHYLHVILGMIILAAVAIKTRRGRYNALEHTGVETGASYWHMVDLVWVILFPLVYIIK